MHSRTTSYLSRRIACRYRESSIALWAPDDYCAEAEAWYTGWGDLSYGARRLPVPALVQLGVLAHASWQRLDDLRRAGPGSRARRVWGASMLSLIDRILAQAPEPRQLHRLQLSELIPLERELLNAGWMAISRSQLISVVAAATSTEAAG